MGKALLKSGWGTWIAAGGLVFGISGSADTRDAATDQSGWGPVLTVIEKTSTGRGMLAKAKEYWALKDRDELVRFLKWGEVSRTDSVLTREYDIQTGTERSNRRVSLSIRKNQPIQEIALDLIHELVHATRGGGWNPYDPEMTVGRYVHQSIDGLGGEVDAVLTECYFSQELLDAKEFAESRCGRYRSAKGTSELDVEKIRSDFYRVGKWYSEVQERLGREGMLFPALSRESPLFFSSTASVPYPAALVEEYRELNRDACRNTLRRLGVVRSMASALHAPNDTLLRFVSRRCGS